LHGSVRQRGHKSAKEEGGGSQKGLDFQAGEGEKLNHLLGLTWSRDKTEQMPHRKSAIIMGGETAEDNSGNIWVAEKNIKGISSTAEGRKIKWTPGGCMMVGKHGAKSGSLEKG